MNTSYLKFFVAASEGGVWGTLGVTWQELVFHAISLVVLVVVLRILFYKPVMKIISDRREKTDNVFKANQELQDESTRLKTETEEMLAKSKQDALMLVAQANATAEEKGRAIVEKAEQQAAAILKIAHQESMVEQTRMKNEFEEKVADIVIELVSKVIGRELVEKDNDKFIKECLKEWEDS